MRRLAQRLVIAMPKVTPPLACTMDSAVSSAITQTNLLDLYGNSTGLKWTSGVCKVDAELERE
jgi:hypothetical protein